MPMQPAGDKEGLLSSAYRLGEETQNWRANMQLEELGILAWFSVDSQWVFRLGDYDNTFP